MNDRAIMSAIASRRNGYPRRMVEKSHGYKVTQQVFRILIHMQENYPFSLTNFEPGQRLSSQLND